jgi:hypothetical protein
MSRPFQPNAIVLGRDDLSNRSQNPQMLRSVGPWKASGRITDRRAVSPTSLPLSTRKAHSPQCFDRSVRARLRGGSQINVPSAPHFTPSLHTPMGSPYGGSPPSRLRTHRYAPRAVPVQQVAGYPHHTPKVRRRQTITVTIRHSDASRTHYTHIPQNPQ